LAQGRSIGRLALVLGGARSGKSDYAEGLITALPRPWIYVATGEAGDPEMVERITAHRLRRGARWNTIEAPQDLAAALGTVPRTAPVLIECLTLWISNRMLAGADVDAEFAGLQEALDPRSGTTVVVSNEVGSGIVPDNALARRFRDLQGRLNQRLAARADHVALMVAGLPVVIKGR
jgi:adenosylcobinamide kinase/adenosylcobinamide-phosphate guanylyltransferase